MSATIKIVCTRAMMFGGVLVKPGEVLSMAGPVRAAELLSSGRCQLVDEADAERVRDAVATDRNRMIGALEVEQQQRNIVGRLRRVG